MSFREQSANFHSRNVSMGQTSDTLSPRTSRVYEEQPIFNAKYAEHIPQETVSRVEPPATTTPVPVRYRGFHSGFGHAQNPKPPLSQPIKPHLKSSDTTERKVHRSSIFSKLTKKRNDSVASASGSSGGGLRSRFSGITNKTSSRRGSLVSLMMPALSDLPPKESKSENLSRSDSVHSRKKSDTTDLNLSLAAALSSSILGATSISRNPSVFQLDASFKDVTRTDSVVNEAQKVTWSAPESWDVNEEALLAAAAAKSGSKSHRNSISEEHEHTETCNHEHDHERLELETLGMVANIEHECSGTSATCSNFYHDHDFSVNEKSTRYGVRIFNTDNTFTTLSCYPDTTVQDILKICKRKFNVPQQQPYQISLRVGHLSKILNNTAKPIMIQRRMLLLSGYQKEDPLNLIGLEDLSFVFKFEFHPETTAHLTYDQESILSRDFVHIDLRNMDLTKPPIIFYQHTSEMESLDVSNNANIFLPLDFIQSSINLSALRMVNIRSTKFPQNITEATKLVTLELERNFIKTIPNSISNLTKLTILNLRCNQIQSLPAGFATLKHLQLLDLSSNNIAKYPEVINECGSLLQLDMSYNKLENIPLSINNLKKIQKLNFANNNLTEIGSLRDLHSLRTLNLRYNRIRVVQTNSESIQNLFLTKNNISLFDDPIPSLRSFDLQNNPITSLKYTIDVTSLTNLCLSKTKLTTLPPIVCQKLVRLEKMELNYNNLTELPEEIGRLKNLVYLSVHNNKLTHLPQNLKQLQKLKYLDLHCNNLRSLVQGIWYTKLTNINISSNLLSQGEIPPGEFLNGVDSPLSKSLLFLSAADNNYDDDAINYLAYFKALKVLNLSYNNLTDMKPLPFPDLTEIYLSGNSFTSIFTEELPVYKNLRVAMVNGNKLHTLPAEISQLKNLSVIDAGSNQLKYNISNHLYDWNWHNNNEIKYLNFSGNKRFEIKSHNNDSMADFTVLKQLRVLGLMDVTLKTSQIPDESISMRLRTNATEINGMGYGVADSLGQRDNITSRDVTFERFRGNDDEALICLYDGKNDNGHTGHKISKVIRDKFDKIMIKELEKYEPVEALKHAFMTLNKEINTHLLEITSTEETDTGGLTAEDMLTGSCATVVYVRGKQVYTANIGDSMAILAKTNGDVVRLTTKHLPTKPVEYERIRTAGGYINNSKLDGVSDVSRAVGFFDLLPHIHAAPDITEFTMTYSDEFIIIATHRLWEYMTYEMAADIARQNKSDPLMIAEKLKDFAIAYGCNDKLTVMCLSLQSDKQSKQRFQFSREDLARREISVEDSNLRRLQPEIPPPLGEIAIVFTDIKNSTSLWETYPDAMRSAIKTHNELMRRQLRLIGGYEVKTEGDAFMVAFPTPTSALVWCLNVQLQLLEAQWPEEIAQSRDGCLITDDSGNKLYFGLSVRMGIHWGSPVPERDIVTQRMDYLGPMVNKAARVSSVADGGEISLSSDFVSELNKILASHKRVAAGEALSSVWGDEFVGEVLEKETVILKGIGWSFHDHGEKSLKGLETKEFITIAYPQALAARHDIGEKDDQPLFNGDLIFKMRQISLRLETILSSLSDSVRDADAKFKMFGDKTRDAIKKTSDNFDALTFMNHLITRMETVIATLYARQRLRGGLYVDEEDSVFKVLDDLLQQAGCISHALS